MIFPGFKVYHCQQQKKQDYDCKHMNMHLLTYSHGAEYPEPIDSTGCDVGVRQDTMTAGIRSHLVGILSNKST